MMALSTATQPRTTAYSWYVVVILTLFYILSFVDRQILNLMVDPIKAHFGITDTAISLLQGIAFALFYCLLGIPIGRLADRANRRNVILAGVLFWSLMTIGCGFATSFLMLFICRMGVGAGEAGLVPASYSMLSDYFKPADLSTATSIFQAGGFLGAGLAMLVGSSAILVAEAMIGAGWSWWGLAPWQIVFILVGLPGILFGWVLLTVREPARTGLAPQPTAQSPQGTATGVLAFLRARWRCFAPLFVGFSLLGMIGMASLAWLPAFLMRARDFSPSEAGFAYGMIFCLFAPLGVVSGGMLAGRLLRRGFRDGPVRTAILGGAGLLPFLIAIPFADGIWLMITLALVTFFVTFPFGLAPAAIQLLCPNHLRAQVSAIYILMINMIGLGMGPTLVAVLTDYYFGNGRDVGASLAIVGAVAGLLAVGILAWGRQHFVTAIQNLQNEENGI